MANRKRSKSKRPSKSARRSAKGSTARQHRKRKLSAKQRAALARGRAARSASLAAKKAAASRRAPRKGQRHARASSKAPRRGRRRISPETFRMTKLQRGAISQSTSALEREYAAAKRAYHEVGDALRESRQ